MFSLAKMSAASEDYYIGLVQYYLGKRARKKKKRRPGSPSDGDPFDDADPDAGGLTLGDPDAFSTAMPGEPPGRWFGQGAAALGLTGIVHEEPFRRVFRGYHPHTGIPLVQNAGLANRRPGWEACFSPPKDFSVLWSQAPPDIRRRLEQLHWEAAETTLRVIEQSFAFSRAGKAAEGCRSVPAGLVVSMFEHGSSRAGDPDLHIHAQILNLGGDAQGQFRALDPLPIFKNQLLFGAYYRAKLAASLRAEFGLRTEQHGRSFRIEGVPRDLVQQYSKRRQQIVEHLAKHGRSGAVAAAHAALETRPDKDPSVSRDGLFQQWQATNSAAGFGDAAFSRLLRHGPRKATTTVPKAIANAVEALTRRKNHFTRQEIVLETLWSLPGYGLDPTAVLPAIDEYLTQSPRIVPLGSADGQNRYTTTSVLRDESRMLSAFDRLATRPGLVVPERSLKKQFRKRPTMRPEQADFVRHMTQTKRASRFGLGFAGTGKTYALKTCCDAWKSQGYRVLGAAPTGQAARVLGREIGINCTTITRLLGDFRLPLSAAVSHHARQLVRAARRRRTWRFRQPRPARVTRKTIILVDESGMIGTRHMRMLAELVAKGRGTLCLVGDPAQLPAIETTSPLQSLARRHGAETLKEIGRQKEPWAREAAQLFAAGKPGEALAMFAARNAIVVRDRPEDAVQQACLDWTAEGLRTPQRAMILANTNELVEAANRLCQDHRLRAGCLQPSSSIQVTDEQDDACYQSRVYVGDRVLFTRNSPRLGVENGSLGTVIAIKHFSPMIHVALDDQRHVTVDVKKFRHIRLGYSATTHKSQGASIPKVFVVLGGSLQNLPASYVQGTRAIEETSFYTTKDLLSPYLENVEKSPLAEQMSRKPDLRLASDFLPDAPVDLRAKRLRVRQVAVPPASADPHAPHRITHGPDPSRSPPTRSSPRQPSQAVASAGNQAPYRITLGPAPGGPSPGTEPRLPPRIAASAGNMDPFVVVLGPAPAESAIPPNRTAEPQPSAAAQPQPVPFDGTYQRLRLTSGTFTVCNGAELVASCVDGGLAAYRHRPPPPRDYAMPFAAASVVVRRIQPTQGPVMSIAEAHRRGMFSLVGTGCQDHVVVNCPPEEMWELMVRDSLGLISPQDDIAAGLVHYNRPGIIQSLESLDRIDDQLRQLITRQSLVASFFVCLRREAAWQMANTADPSSINRTFLRRFCRMLFEDQRSRHLIHTLVNNCHPLEVMYTLDILRASMPIPASDDFLGRLNDALHANNPHAALKERCVDIAVDWFGQPHNSELRRQLDAYLEAGVAIAKSILAKNHPSTRVHQQLMSLLYANAESNIPSDAKILILATQYLPIDHDTIQHYAPIRHLWRYATAYLSGDEARTEQLYQEFVQAMALQARR